MQHIERHISTYPIDHILNYCSWNRHSASIEKEVTWFSSLFYIHFYPRTGHSTETYRLDWILPLNQREANGLFLVELRHNSEINMDIEIWN